MIPSAILVLALVVGQGGPMQPAAPDKPQIEAALRALQDPLAGLDYARVPTPADAVAAAATDLASLHPSVQPWQRYIWIRNPTKAKVGATIYGLETISSATTGCSPVVLANGALVRVDLRRLAPIGDDLTRIRDIWEDYGASNFYFNTIREVTKQIEVKVPGKITEQRVQVRNNYNQIVWTTKKVQGPDEIKLEDQKVLVSEPSIHTNLHNALLLHVLSGKSRAPLVRFDHFLITALTTIDGGRYYDWKNIRKSPDSSLTDLEFFLKDKFGVSEAELARLRSDQKIAMFVSNVTSRPRRVRFFNSSAVRATDGSGLVTITDDCKRGSISAKQHPIKSLDSKKADAHEVIGLQANGFQIYAIFDGDGNLALEVPSDVAHDSTIPSPFDQTLVPGLSCISCHASNEGWIPAANHVQRLHKQIFTEGYTPRQLRILDDEQSEQDVLETLDRLQGQFSGDAERTAFRQARNDHHRVTFVRTGGVGSKEAMSTLRDIRNDYLFRHVTPRTICEEMGYLAANEATAVEIFNRLVPLTPVNQFGIRTEDPVVAAFRSYDELESIPVNRLDLEPVYSDIMLRVKTGQAAQLLKQGTNP